MPTPDRLPLSTAAVAYLTESFWGGPDVTGCCCPTCDDSEATLIGAGYCLQISAHGVLAEGYCRGCGAPLSALFGVLQPARWQQALAALPAL